MINRSLFRLFCFVFCLLTVCDKSTITETVPVDLVPIRRHQTVQSDEKTAIRNDLPIVKLMLNISAGRVIHEEKCQSGTQAIIFQPETEIPPSNLVEDCGNFLSKFQRQSMGHNTESSSLPQPQQMGRTDEIANLVNCNELSFGDRNVEVGINSKDRQGELNK